MKTTDLEITIEEMRNEETSDVVKVIADALNAHEGKLAQDTIDFHYFCKKNGKDDGRIYLVAKTNDKIVGICGLHRYIWGPDDITWLGWFTVKTEFQRRGIGHKMMTKTCELAKQRGFKKIFIETYDDDNFAKGRNFYEKFGFKKVGEIKKYLTDGTNMVVYGRDL